MENSAIRIAVIAPYVGDGKEILLGVADSIRDADNWVLRPIDLSSRLALGELVQWNPKGIVLFQGDQGLEAFAEERAIPLVRVLNRKAGDRISTINVDNEAVVRLAVDYFISRNFVHFAYIGNVNFQFSLARREAFLRLAGQAGKTTHEFMHPTAEAAARVGEDLMYHANVGSWLASLPKPVALLAANDWDGLEAIQACALHGIRVPEEVAVLGVGNDELACKVARPEMSSIRLPFREVAREAVAALRSQIGARARPVMIRQVQLAPLGLVTRASTQFFPVEDELVADTLKYMGTHINKVVKIQDLLRHFDVSRSHLEKRFRTALGRTPLVELRRQRIEAARRFLIDTDLPMKRISRLSGFSSEIRFTTVFREMVGQSPTEFRAASQQLASVD